MPASRPVRLIDVAREAGVSITTVSHTLSGKGRIPEATRARVQQVAVRMGYQPNAVARRLAGGRTRLIAVAFSLAGELPVRVTDVNYFNQAIHAATARALERDYALVVCPPTPHTEMWSRIPIDGLVILDPVAGDPVLAEMRARSVPLVLCGRDPTGEPQDYCVDNDHIAGTRTVLDHLEERGAQRIALLAGDLGDAFTDDCIAAHRAWCIERGLEPMMELVPFGRMSDPAHPLRLLQGPRPPTAVYANEEALGAALLQATERQGLRVPDDLLIVVAGESQPADATVALTTLELNPAGTVEQAVDVLIELIEGRPPAERLTLIPTHLVVRDSTGGPAPV